MPSLASQTLVSENLLEFSGGKLLTALQNCIKNFVRLGNKLQAGQ
jgi:hypothetical protein